jgi:hypothetical protein
MPKEKMLKSLKKYWIKKLSFSKASIKLASRRKSIGDKILAVYGLKRETEILPSSTNKLKPERASTLLQKSRMVTRHTKTLRA